MPVAAALLPRNPPCDVPSCACMGEAARGGGCEWGVSVTLLYQ